MEYFLPFNEGVNVLGYLSEIIFKALISASVFSNINILPGYSNIYEKLQASRALVAFLQQHA